MSIYSKILGAGVIGIEILESPGGRSG